MFPGQRELRHGMIQKISDKIQAAVLSVGRTKEDLKKYTLNIEQTAWTQSRGVQVCAGLSMAVGAAHICACPTAPCSTSTVGSFLTLGSAFAAQQRQTLHKLPAATNCYSMCTCKPTQGSVWQQSPNSSPPSTQAPLTISQASMEVVLVAFFADCVCFAG